MMCATRSSISEQSATTLYREVKYILNVCNNFKTLLFCKIVFLNYELVVIQVFILI